MKCNDQLTTPGFILNLLRAVCDMMFNPHNVLSISMYLWSSGDKNVPISFECFLKYKV